MAEPTVRSEVAGMLRGAQIYLSPDKIDLLAQHTAKMREVHGLHVKSLESKKLTAKRYLEALRGNNEIFMRQARIVLGKNDFEKLFGEAIEFPIDDDLFLSINHESQIARWYYLAKVEIAARIHLIRHNLTRRFAR